MTSVRSGLAPWARLCHGGTAAVTAFALVFQLWLVVAGQTVLLTAEPPSMGTRLIRFFSYFTILSNILVLATCASLVADPRRDGRPWRVVRLNAIVGIGVTAIVHWFLLRPILHLSGAPWSRTSWSTVLFRCSPSRDGLPSGPVDASAVRICCLR